jgi:hypothetical protein
MSGFHFFVFKSIQQLKLMNLEDALFSKEWDLYIPMELNNFVKQKYK